MAEASYDREYYDRFRPGARRSAQAVVPLVLELLAPRSVVDVGCGAGTWLKVFEEHGIGDFCGVDGEYVRETAMEIPADRFVAADLSLGVSLDRRFDLAVSLEVAEHLPEESADNFVQGLTALAPVVMFSAAIPHQAGLGHVNEQWPEYWRDLFQRRNFVAVDYVRPRIWENPDVRLWYVQNTLLFVEQTHLESYPELKREYECSRNRPLSIIHPEMFQRGLKPWSHLERLKAVRDKGIVTAEEFEAKKAEILSRL